MALLASAPTQQGILECMARFYCGEEKQLEPDLKANQWTVHRPCGQQLLGVRVIKRGKRYRFETIG